MYIISKLFEFSASHVLAGLPPEHQCGRLHGHNFQVELVLRSAMLNEHGFVVDYGDLKPFSDYIAQNLDHHHLNDVLYIQPTAENIAQHLYDVASTYWRDVVYMVRVSETAKTWATYSPDQPPPIWKFDEARSDELKKAVLDIMTTNTRRTIHPFWHNPEYQEGNPV